MIIPIGSRQTSTLRTRDCLSTWHVYPMRRHSAPDGANATRDIKRTCNLCKPTLAAALLSDARPT